MIRIREGTKSSHDFFCRGIQIFESHHHISGRELEGSILSYNMSKGLLRSHWIGNQDAHERQTAKMELAGWGGQLLKRKSQLRKVIWQEQHFWKRQIREKDQFSPRWGGYGKTPWLAGILTFLRSSVQHPNVMQGLLLPAGSREIAENTMVKSSSNQVHPRCSWDPKPAQQLLSSCTVKEEEFQTERLWLKTLCWRHLLRTGKNSSW